MTTNKQIHLPVMGCVTWAWGNRLLWDYPEIMDSQLQEVFNLCVSKGVTLFDRDSYGTRKLKGRSKILLSNFTQKYQGINQEKIYLATKLVPYPWRLTAKSIVNAGLASANRIGRIDSVQMHWSTANYL